jgi:hypothetical protein
VKHSRQDEYTFEFDGANADMKETEGLSLRMQDRQRECEPFRVSLLGDKFKLVAVVTDSYDLSSTTAVAKVALAVGRTLQGLSIFSKENIKFFLSLSFLSGSPLSSSGAKGGGKLIHMNLSCFRFYMDPQTVTVALTRVWLDRFLQAWCAVTELVDFYTDVFARTLNQLAQSGEGSLQSTLASEVLGEVNDAMTAFGLVFRRLDGGALSREKLALALKEALYLDVSRVRARSMEKTMMSMKRKLENDQQASGQFGNGKSEAGQTAAGYGAVNSKGPALQSNQGMCQSFMCQKFASAAPCQKHACKFLHAWPTKRDAGWKQKVIGHCANIFNVSHRALVIAGVQKL